MPQEQRQVPLEFLDGRESLAIATGNNAAWNCQCSDSALLIGRTGMLRGPSNATQVICRCGRSYFVVPAGKDQGRVERVREIQQ